MIRIPTIEKQFFKVVPVCNTGKCRVSICGMRTRIKGFEVSPKLNTYTYSNTSPYSDKLLNSLSRTRSTIRDLSIANFCSNDYFFTQTFNPERVNSFDFDTVDSIFKEKIHYLKSVYPGLKYIYVFEKHKSGRVHIHGLISGIPSSEFVFSGHRDKKLNKIFNLPRWSDSLGFNTFTKINDSEKTSSYISKYITKDLASMPTNKLHKNLYRCSLGLIRAIRGETRLEIDVDYKTDFCSLSYFDVELDSNFVSTLLSSLPHDNGVLSSFFWLINSDKSLNIDDGYLRCQFL